MSEPLPKPWTVDDFLAWERRQPERYEFFGGVVRMMVGGSNSHTIVKDNVVAALRDRLRDQPCRALGEGPKVVTTMATMYPDAVVVCGLIDWAEDQVRSPTLVVEVLSRSTEDHDRGAKWVACRGLASWQHYSADRADQPSGRSVQPGRRGLDAAHPRATRRGGAAGDRGRAELRGGRRGQRRLIPSAQSPDFCAWSARPGWRARLAPSADLGGRRGAPRGAPREGESFQGPI